MDRSHDAHSAVWCQRPVGRGGMPFEDCGALRSHRRGALTPRLSYKALHTPSDKNPQVPTGPAGGPVAIDAVPSQITAMPAHRFRVGQTVVVPWSGRLSRFLSHNGTHFLIGGTRSLCQLSPLTR
jgi:hypothetical protein